MDDRGNQITATGSPPAGKSRRHRRVRIALLAIVIAQVLYGAIYIHRSSFWVEGKRYYCLFDDAMISMRYAAHWAAGDGLVWNVGERVEGYTNFGWTMVMGVVHLLRLSPMHSCLLVQILGLAIWVGCSFATVSLARACRAPPIAVIIAVVLTITQWNLIFFSLNGMETGLQTLLVTLGLGGVVRGMRSRTARVTPFVWFALAMLVRPDVLLIIGLSTAGLLWICARRSRTLFGFAIVVVVVAGHTLWRKQYYGAWFPNTYYLKATGWPLAQRLISGYETSRWTVVSLVLPLVLGFCNWRRCQPAHILLVGAFLLMLAYGTYVGGDAWPLHYRFVVVATPGLMIWAAIGLERALRDHLQRASRSNVRWVAVIAMVLAANALHFNKWVQSERPYGTYANQTSVRYALAAKKIAVPEALAAVGWAGAFPYYAELRCVDLWGKCETHIAHLPAKPDVKRAGHNKFDSPYVLSTYEPDLVVDRLSDFPESFFRHYRAARITVDGVAMVLAVRRGSDAIHADDFVTWDEARDIYFAARRD